MDTGTSSGTSPATPPPPVTPAQSSSANVAMDAGTAAARRDWLLEHPPARSLPLDQEALRIYQHAYAIGLETEPASDPVITFSTVLMALFLGGDETSRWFAGEAANNGPQATLVFSDRSKSEQEIRSIKAVDGRPDAPRLSTDKQLLTLSARAVIEGAEAWAQLVGATDIGVRHVVAAYVLNPPPAHYAQLERWKYQPANWREKFSAWTAQRYTAEPWSDTQHRPAPAKRVAEHEHVRVKGEALGSADDPQMVIILDRAAMYHARSKDRDRFLRLQTLFCALVESARDEAQLRARIQPIWDAVGKAGPAYTQMRDAQFPPSQTDRLPVPFSACDLSSRVINTIETARELTLAAGRGAGGVSRVGVLQLAGAVISRRVDAAGELAKFGLDARTLRDDLIEHATKLGERVDVWKEAVGDEEIQFVGRPVDLNSDEPEAAVRSDESFSDDPLRIKADVETFASLLASSTLEPPLSIGLFGPWGSGKSTFLKRLRRAVEKRADAAAEDVKDGRPTPYARNIVHVEFNAWHFAETALTSSLIDTIFRALNRYIKDEQPISGKTWRDLKLAALASTERKLEAARAVEDAARENVVKAEKGLANSQTRAAKALSTFESASQSVWAALKGGAEKSDIEKTAVVKAAGDAVKGLQDLQIRLTAVRNRPARLIGDLGWPSTIVFALLVLAGPPLVAWLVGKAMGTDQAVQSLSSIGAMLAVIGTWVRTATRAVSKVDAAITSVLEEYESRIATNGAVVKAQAELDSAKTEAATAAASVQAAREALARAQSEAANASLPAQMLQLVSSRIDAETYKKELTTISLAREDLQVLSTLLRTPQDAAAGAATTGPASGMTPRAVDRVILYIDDLDRCRPEDVVRVLQLVHMLLAFELFAVVVAVDARWVYASLTQSYRWLARDGDPAVKQEGTRVDGTEADDTTRDGIASPVTPQDYLEKIFQIVFWLEPMTSTRAARYLGSLISSPVRKERWQDVTDLADEPPSSGAVSSAPGKIGIAGIELDYMRALAAHVGTSPRRVKRLVNAYRLLKASLSDSQLRTFLTNRAADGGGDRSGPYQIVIGLLVIGTGVLGSSAQILGELSGWDPNKTWSDVIDSFRARHDPDWTQAAQVLEIVFGTQKPQDVGELRGWARKVSRYLLSGPVAGRLSGGLQPPVAARSQSVP
jgi:hypothetical protein